MFLMILLLQVIGLPSLNTTHSPIPVPSYSPIPVPTSSPTGAPVWSPTGVPNINQRFQKSTAASSTNGQDTRGNHPSFSNNPV